MQIIQWFVQPGARVEQFDKICEVASDKANVEITSRFDGVIKQLHHEQDDVVQVGTALLDIDVQSDISPEDEALLAPEPEQAGKKDAPQQPQKAAEQVAGERKPDEADKDEERNSKRTHKGLATPAVRGLLKEKKLELADVKGTGRDGRVLKEDIYRHVTEQEESDTRSKASMSPARPVANLSEEQVETPITLTSTQAQMFKTMTRSLQVPHFLYADEIDITALSSLRRRLNALSASSDGPKLSYLPFIVKAVSLALADFPAVNARVDTASDTQKPQLVLRQNHNIGIAMDTRQGLLVPNIKNVSALSVLDIAAEISRLQALAKEGKLSAKDLTGGTFTVSNIGSIGGTYVAPVIVQSEVAILGIGKSRTVPAFGEHGEIRKKEVMNFSWSADHRVVDGATLARCAERVRMHVEGVEGMVVRLR